MHFALPPSESEVVGAARTVTAAVHLTLRIGYFKAKSQFYVFDLDAVSADLLHILGRHFPGRGMHEFGVLSKPTRMAQQRIVLQLFDCRLCDTYLKDDRQSGSHVKGDLFAVSARCKQQKCESLETPRMRVPETPRIYPWGWFR